MKGYYQPAIAAGEPQEELVEELLSDFYYAARYFLDGYYSPHSGIHLACSSNNTISRNEICDNLGDGIYLGPCDNYAHNENNGSHINTPIYNGGSDSNQITYNYIHGNWHGIFIDASDDNTIRYNDIINNVWVPSGIHVAANSSGNVANCNNIEDNGAYGVWNDPGNPRLDATKNWWGSADGPSLSPGSGDRVSDNVDYEPWIRDEFQYCEECGGTRRPPPGVSTANHWGIVAMIALFASLLVWTVRRRISASRMSN